MLEKLEHLVGAIFEVMIAMVLVTIAIIASALFKIDIMPCTLTEANMADQEPEEYVRPELTQEEALKIYEKIRALGGAELNTALDDAIKTTAGMMQGLWAVAASWNGTTLPPDLADLLKFEFGEGYLYARNLVSYHGEWIELGVLTGKLPDSILLEGFHFSMEDKAKEMDLDLGKLKAALKEAFAGIDTDCVGGKLFAFRDVLEDGYWTDAMRILGAGSLYGDWGRGRGFRGIRGEGLAGEHLKEILEIEDLDNPLVQFPGDDLRLKTAADFAEQEEAA